MSGISVPLTLPASVLNIQDYTTWDVADGVGDPYVGYAYQWSVDISVQPQLTGEWQLGFAHTEYDVQIGDWLIMSSSLPLITVQIIDILSVNNGVINCIVEDVDRYNIYLTGSSGIGLPSPSGVYDGLIIRLGEDGLAVFSNVSPGSLPVTTQEEINSRFRFRNYLQNNYRTYQENNTFAVGDLITLNANGKYVLASAVGTAAYRVIGRVKDINIPGAGWFTYEPKGKLVRYLTPNLPGSPGGIVYLDPNNPGQLTASKPNSGIAIPIFIKINNSTGVKLDEILQGGLDNYIATRAPAVSDDSSLGYSYGSIWVDVTNKKSYINVDPAIGQSNWQLIGSATASLASKTAIGSVKIGDNIDVDQGVISVKKGAGINKVVDIADVDSTGLTNGVLLSYNSSREKWETASQIDLNIDGGEY